MKPKSKLYLFMRDLLTFGFAFFVSLYFFRDSGLTRNQWLVFFYLMVVFFLIEFLKKPGINIRGNFKARFFNHVTNYMLCTALLIVFYFLVPIPWKLSGRFFSILIAFCLLDFLLNYILVELIQRHRVSFDMKQVIVAGTGVIADNIEKKIFAGQERYQVRGFIDCNVQEKHVVSEDRVLGNLDNFDDYLLENTVDEIVIALPGYCTSEIQNVLSVADYHGVRVKYILDYHEMFGNHYKITRMGRADALSIRQTPTDDAFASGCKTCFDFAFSFVALLCLLPVFAVIALVIKMDSRGPVFYFPIRIGRGGKPFKLYKFRSMRESDSAANGTMSTQKNDPRVTRVGKVLRKYSLDELPQFINVLLGDMSVVGPRPHRRFLNRQLQQSVYKYMIRHYVKPGITGWAQVNGWRGPTDTDEQRTQRTMHDLWYVENWSFWLDIKIIYLTLFSKKTYKAAF